MSVDKAKKELFFALRTEILVCRVLLSNIKSKKVKKAFHFSYENSSSKFLSLHQKLQGILNATFEYQNELDLRC